MAPRVLQDPKEFPVQEPRLWHVFATFLLSTAVSFESPEDLCTFHENLSYSEKYLSAVGLQIAKFRYYRELQKRKVHGGCLSYVKSVRRHQLALLVHMHNEEDDKHV